MMELDELLLRTRAKRTGADKWMGFCPAHPDEHRSLSIARSDGKILLHCFAGCEYRDILAALDGEPNGRPRERRVAAVYSYRDEAGELLFQVVRYIPKAFAQRRPDGDGGWSWDLKGVRRVLYQLPEVLAVAAAGETIFVVEGEKDCDALAALGLAATTNPGGAGKWRPEYSGALAGARVVIIPDNDEPGRRHAEQVAQSLQGTAAEVRVLELPDLPPKGDVSDWLSRGGTKEQLLRLAAEAPPWVPGTAEVRAPQEEARFTDVGNARRFVALHGRDLRFCHPWERWLVWTGKRWSEDQSGEVMRRARDVPRSLFKEAAECSDAKTREGLAAWALACESEARLRAMVSLARSEPGIPVLPGELDADPYLFNAANGTVDLRSGELRPHRRQDLMTKVAGAAYDPGAACPTWEAFLGRAMNGNENLIRFLKRAVGYTLTGDTREQCLFLLYGTGANGKSTFIETVRTVLGDYGKQASFDTFLAGKQDATRNDVAALVGARFVAAVEAGQGRRLAEVLVKLLTGGDTVTARFLYHEFFEFKPVFKLFLACNAKPVIRGADNAIWRRIRLVPFTVTIPDEEQDRTLPANLKAEAEGILAWAVQGCLEWQREGLKAPPEVMAATQAYRDEMDPLGGFLNESCILSPAAKAPAADLYGAYKAWCERVGEEPLTQTTFGLRLGERGLSKARGTAGRTFWHGIGLAQGGRVNSE